MPGWPNYVALGDSLTAGRDDHDSEGGHQVMAAACAGLLLAG
jgi:lysophospholipase L1-like esterase